MVHNASFDTEEVENVYSYAYDGPQPYNYEPARRPRDQGLEEITAIGEKLSCGVRRISGEQGSCLGE